MGRKIGYCQVQVTRGGRVESLHHVSVAVVDAQGRLRAHAGDPNRPAFARSAVKAMQALPLVEDGVVGQFGITEEELALCCASHNAEARHIELAAALLRRAGVGEEGLACGPHWPMSAEAARQLRERGEEPGRIHNNCSGKHAGMLALARFHGWPLAGYQDLEHPVQQRMLREVQRWTGLEREDIGLAVDGCGVVTFAVPIFALARGFAAFAAAARRGEPGPAAVVQAMVRHPWVVAGTDRLCTAVMRAAQGRVIVKVGAEGVYAGGVPGAELGIALKVHDGATRAAEPALVAVLQGLGVLTGEELGELTVWSDAPVTNTRGEQVGSIKCRARLAIGS